MINNHDMSELKLVIADHHALDVAEGVVLLASRVRIAAKRKADTESHAAKLCKVGKDGYTSIFVGPVLQMSRKLLVGLP